MQKIESDLFEYNMDLDIEEQINFPSEISRNFNHLKSHGNSKFHH